MSNLEAALSYIARGWAVFPCHHVVWTPTPDGMSPACSCRRGLECGANTGKHPRIRGGFHSATIDEAEVRGWWTKWPEANVGIATGAPSGLTVVDLDGDAGFHELQALLAGDTLPGAPAVQTGSGAHLYFAWTGERSSARGKVHIRGEGGYVIAPPSNHRSGRSYQWLTPPDSSLSPLPPNLKVYADAGSPPPPDSSFPPPPSWLHSHDPNSVSISSKIANNIRPEWTAHEEMRLRSALAALPADDYDTWTQWGMALQNLEWVRADGTDAGFDIWDAWSQSCPDKYAPEICEEKWRSFGRTTRNQRRITIASIYHAAREAGWDARTTAPLQPDKVNGHNNLPTVFNGTPQGFAFAQQTFVAGGSNAIIFPDVDRSGRPKPTCQNTRAAIRGLGLSASYDRFHDRYFLGGEPIGEWAGEFTDSAMQALRSVVHEVYGFDPGSQAAYDAGIQEGLDNAFDPVADYLDGLTWDRVPRLATWLQVYLGADDNPLNRGFGTLGLVAAVRRARVPGAKFDQIIVLEGAEGTRKSSAIECLAEAAGPGNYSDSTILTLDDRGQQEAVQGVWLYEIADLTGISRAEVERVKAFASRRVDRARPAYGRSRQDRPRRCVFFATTNHDTYLKSQTGNRRFWPVRTGTIDLERLEEDRHQLWAEACAIERGGAPLILPPALWGQASELQDSRREHDPWDDIIEHVEADLLRRGTVFDRADMPDQRELRISTRDLLELHLKLPADRQTDFVAKRLAHVMRRAGWRGPLKMRAGDTTLRGYAKNA